MRKRYPSDRVGAQPGVPRQASDRIAPVVELVLTRAEVILGPDDPYVIAASVSMGGTNLLSEEALAKALRDLKTIVELR